MRADPDILQMKYADVIKLFSENANISLDKALLFFLPLGDLSAYERWCFGYALYERCLSCGRLNERI